MIALLHIDSLEIIEHALEDGVIAHRLQVGVAPRHHLPIHVCQALLTVLLTEDFAPIVRSNPEDRWLGSIAHQKMPWHADANNGQANGLLDLSLLSEQNPQSGGLSAT